MAIGKSDARSDVDEGLNDYLAGDSSFADDAADAGAQLLDDALIDDGPVDIDPLDLLDDYELDDLQAKLDAHREAALGAMVRRNGDPSDVGVFVPREPGVEHYLLRQAGVSVRPQRRYASGDFMNGGERLPEIGDLAALELQAKRAMAAAANRLDRMGNPGGGMSVDAVVDTTRANFDTTDGSMLFRPEEWEL